jgi:hypothetical protein
MEELHPTRALMEDSEFRDLDEESQVKHLMSVDQDFRDAFESDPEETMRSLRDMVGRKQYKGSATGEAIRGFGRGLGAAGLDTLQLPFETAEFLSSLAGGEYRSDINQALEEFEQEHWARPEEGPGQIAYDAGWGMGTAASFFAGGLGAAKVPGMIGKAGKFLTSTAGPMRSKGLGLAAEMTGGATGNVAAEQTAKVTDNMWLIGGAAVLAGVAGGGAMMGAINKTTKRRMQRAAEGMQPLDSGESSSLPPPQVGEEVATPVGVGVVRKVKGDDIHVAQRDGRELTYSMETWNGTTVRTKAQQAAQDAMDNINAEELAELRKAHGYAPESLTAMWEGESQTILELMHEGTKKTLDAGLYKRIARIGAEIMKKAGIKYDKRQGLMDQMFNVIDAKLIPEAEMNAIAKATGGLAISDVRSVWRLVGRESGRRLEVLKDISNGFKKAGMILTDDQLKGLGAAANENGIGMWRRLENVRRGMLVTQVATAARNFETQMVNLTLHGLADVVDKAIDIVIPSVKGSHEAIKPFKAALRVFMSHGDDRARTNAIEEFFAKNEDPIMHKLFRHFSSDLEDIPSGVFTRDAIGNLEKASHLLNSVNRFQEYTIRRAVFTDELERVLHRKGMNLDDLIEKGDLKKLARVDVEHAIQRALDVTWGKDYAGGTFAGNFIKFMNSDTHTPFQLTQLLPFPRFMANAFEWQFRHSPLGVTRYMSPKQRQAFRGVGVVESGDTVKSIAKKMGVSRERLLKLNPKLKVQKKGSQLALPEGMEYNLGFRDTRALSETLIGTGITYGAWETRRAQPDDARWYEIKPPEMMAQALNIDPDKYIDTRAFNPFSTYLFAMHMVNKSGILTGEESTVGSVTVRDIIQGVAGANMRAGAGLYLVDQAIQKFVDTFEGMNIDESTLAEAALTPAAEFFGEAWAGMLVPFSTVKDLVAQFDEGERRLRDERDELPGIGPIKRRLPYAADDQPELRSPLRAGPIIREDPLLRQLFGLTRKSAKNLAESEADKFGFTRSDLLPSSGDESYDAEMAARMGPMVESNLLPYLRSERYQNSTSAEQAELYKARIREIQKAARVQTGMRQPSARSKLEERRKGRRARSVLKERNQSLKERKNRLEGQRLGGDSG